MRTIIFNPAYESKLKQLRFKTRFCLLLNASRLSGETLDEAAAYVNAQLSWLLFITGGFDFLELSEEERKFWTNIAAK